MGKAVEVVGASHYETRQLMLSFCRWEHREGHGPSGLARDPRGPFRTEAGDPEDEECARINLRVDCALTNRPQQQEDGQSEERDADQDTHQAGMGEDQNCGADRCCYQPERSHWNLLPSAYAVDLECTRSRSTRYRRQLS
jgi:hypothetical protein